MKFQIVFSSSLAESLFFFLDFLLNVVSVYFLIGKCSFLASFGKRWDCSPASLHHYFIQLNVVFFFPLYFLPCYAYAPQLGGRGWARFSSMLLEVFLFSPPFIFHFEASPLLFLRCLLRPHPRFFGLDALEVPFFLLLGHRSPPLFLFLSCASEKSK